MTDRIKISPGPELDALVAEQVMGWSKKNGSPFWRDENGNPQWDVFPFPPGYEYACHGRTWRPSLDISAAWMVVERFTQERWRIELRYLDSAGWYCRISRGVHFGEATADSAPYVICQAALAVACYSTSADAGKEE